MRWRATSGVKAGLSGRPRSAVDQGTSRRRQSASLSAASACRKPGIWTRPTSARRLRYGAMSRSLLIMGVATAGMPAF
ncbi:MAG TPA: hypothetical protein DC063_08520 [Arenimonas sp.]|nr:hypothetical protein [Arenimonas sp.]